MSLHRLSMRLLAPFYRHIPMARFLLWQARFLTEVGNRNLTIRLLAGKADIITFERQGIHWTVYPGDESVGIPLFIFDGFDRTALKLVRDWRHAHGMQRKGTTILEIGANIGSTSIPLLQSTPGRLVAIEPVPHNLVLLKQNLAQNGFADRVQIVEQAISEDGQDVDMIVPLGGLGGSEIERGATDRSEAIFQTRCETVRVSSTRLDTLLDRLNLSPAEVDLVWCDIQGSEGAVLRTGNALWQAGVPLWAEIAPRLIGRQQSVTQFVKDANARFHSFLIRTDLETQGSAAVPQPMEAFASFVAGLHGDAQMDVLFLPH